MFNRLYRLLAKLSPARLLMSVFAGTVLAGALLLSLPMATVSGKQISMLDALFTSASAVCVTGLIVVDTGSVFTTFGQLVILALIQAGGLGIMTFAAIGFKLFGARLPITHQQALEDCFFQRNAALEFSHTFPRILKLVITVQFFGFLMLLAGMMTQLPFTQAAYSALFHSISAFCNAGFSIYANNLVELRHNPLVMSTIMLLIVLGGLGHIVLRELHGYFAYLFKSNRDQSTAFRFSFHSRVVLAMAAILIVGGTIALLIAGIRDGASPAAAACAALFQSISARTAGFNTVDIGGLPLPVLLVISILMFIGGAPGSCAGGIKTTSFMVWMGRVRAALQGSDSVSLMGREIPRDLVQRAVAVVGLATIWNTVGVILLAFALPDGTSLQDILFEQVSAFGTVGLSTGTTAQLNACGKLWIIATMFVGRLGPLTMLLSFVTTTKPRIRFAEGRIMVG